MEYLGIPDFHSTGGPFWAANILAPCSRWGYDGTSTNQNLGIQPGGAYGSISVLWRGAVPSRLDYVPRSPDTRAPLCAAYVTITFKVGVWRACIVPLPSSNPSLIHGSIGRMMIRRVRLINNFVDNSRFRCQYQ